MKERALKLADDIYPDMGKAIDIEKFKQASDMIRKLVAEIDTYRLKNSNQIDTYKYETKPLSDEEIWAMASVIEPIDLSQGIRLSNEFNVLDFARAIEERHGIK